MVLNYVLYEQFELFLLLFILAAVGAVISVILPQVFKEQLLLIRTII